MTSNLFRFKEAQRENYNLAYKELQSGKKTSHWMWYIFPQLNGLGHSKLATYYAIKDIEEAISYLEDEELYNNLVNISKLLLEIEHTNPIEIFGQTDALKLCSSMTLFAHAAELMNIHQLQAESTHMPELFPKNSKESTDNQVFELVLDKFYAGKKDPITENILFYGDIPKEMPVFIPQKMKKL